MLKTDFSSEGWLGYFLEISRLPRGSGSCGAIADYLCAFAEKQGLEYLRDDAHNVFIKKPGKAGCPSVMLQGHTDMVCCASPGKEHDFGSGVTVESDGEWLYANETTLGADNGVAVAYMLAVLADNTPALPPLECVFTSDEEIGLLGAIAFDFTSCRAQYLINMDCDEEGVMVAGCAGGARIDVSFPFERTHMCGGAVRVTVSGLSGGHSGTEINRGRENAIKLMGRALLAAYELSPFYIIVLSGGEKDNAIPRFGEALLIGADADALEKAFSAEKMRLAEREPGFEYRVEQAGDLCTACLSEKDTLALLTLINEMPYGVLEESAVITGMPEVSANPGVLKTGGKGACLNVSVRSASDEKKKNLCREIKAAAVKHGAKISVHGEYPGWEIKERSHLRNIMNEVWRKETGENMKTEVIHAGLECGVITSAMPWLDAVSIGPEMHGIHTPQEKLSLASAHKYYRFTVKVLRQIAEDN